MIFGDGLGQYFYYKKLAEREKERIANLEKSNPYLKFLRSQGRLVHLGLDRDEIAKRMVRTGGGTVCKECGKTHREHRMIDDYLFYDEPFLYYICDGTIAKL